jgi:hypothetical protein
LAITENEAITAMPFVCTSLGTRKPSDRRLDLGDRSSDGLLVRALKALVPAANPDVDLQVLAVARWWIEVDNEGVPIREVGFDDAGAPIVATPFGENYGFWTDSDMRFPPSEHEPVDAKEFELAWLAFFRSRALPPPFLGSR